MLTLEFDKWMDNQDERSQTIVNSTFYDFCEAHDTLETHLGHRKQHYFHIPDKVYEVLNDKINTLLKILQNNVEYFKLRKYQISEELKSIFPSLKYTKVESQFAIFLGDLK